MKKAYSGQDHEIWQLDENNNGLLEQMKPLQCQKIFRRGYEGKVDTHNMAGWDCDCGVYVIGTLEHVEKSFEKLYDWMKLRTDSIIVNDLVESDALDYMALFTSKKDDIAIIIGGGYYECTEENFLEILNNLENVSVGEIGANYTSDQDLYRTILEDIDYIDYNKKVYDQQLGKIEPLQLALMAEVFEYWEENDIYTKADRVEDDILNVDKVVEKYIKKQSRK